MADMAVETGRSFTDLMDMSYSQLRLLEKAVTRKRALDSMMQLDCTLAAVVAGFSGDNKMASSIRKTLREITE